MRTTTIMATTEVMHHALPFIDGLGDVLAIRHTPSLPHIWDITLRERPEQPWSPLITDRATVICQSKREAGRYTITATLEPV